MRAPRPHTPRQDCISCTRQTPPAVFFSAFFMMNQKGTIATLRNDSGKEHPPTKKDVSHIPVKTL